LCGTTAGAYRERARTARRSQTLFLDHRLHARDRGTVQTVDRVEVARPAYTFLRRGWRDQDYRTQRLLPLLLALCRQLVDAPQLSADPCQRRLAIDQQQAAAAG